MKTCRKCKESKELTEFNTHKKTLDGLNSWCKPCNSEYSKAWYTKNQERMVVHKRYESMKRVYGITKEEYNEMYNQQKGLCFICEDASKLMIDHDHNTGKVRSLLCRACNFGLGNFRDNPSLLNTAIGYLKHHGN